MKRLILLLLLPVLAIGSAFALLRFAWSAMFAPEKAWRIALGVDDLDNVALNGRLGQTISSRAAYARRAGRRWGCVLCRFLDGINPGHCDRALTAPDQNLESQPPSTV
ncbi:MAG: hypothetical protein KGL35_17005 [Bradyrhizobium sp.]|nr:hypothetical protein [Bradyrhizobium sp.]